MAVIFRLSTRDERQPRTCCFCDREVEQDPVELFAFWPGDEDPTPFFAHESCVAQHSSMRPRGAESDPDSETGS